jgi:hypothetical protein
MKQLRIATWTAVALLAAGARAGETPYGSQGPSVYYYACIAMPGANGAPAYASAVFADTAKVGQAALNDAFRKFLKQKYGLSGQNGVCQAAASADGAEAGKKDMTQHIKNVVETGWKPSS